MREAATRAGEQIQRKRKAAAQQRRSVREKVYEKKKKKRKVDEEKRAFDKADERASETPREKQWNEKGANLNLQREATKKV